MKHSEPWRSFVPTITASLFVALIPLLSGCMGPQALKRSVLGYDETTATLEQQLLLLNIARRDAGYPIHFTVTGSIAATFDWTTSASAGGRLEEPSGTNTVFELNVNTSGSENPTFSIFPISGEEFTQRILTPISEDIFNTIVFQSPRFDQTLRLLAGGIQIQRPDNTFVRLIHNDSGRHNDYEEFRRIVLHLQSLFATQQLFVYSLVFNETLLESWDQPTPQDITEAYLNGFEWRRNPDGSYDLTRLGAGRLIITNYDPRSLSDDERWEINERIKGNPNSFVYLDIDPYGPGGEFPLQGVIRLRSIQQIIDFIARGIQKSPEFDVAPDPRTRPSPALNPVATVRVNASERKPPGNIISIFYQGKYYSVADTEWDKSVFRILSWLFQASVGEIQSPGLPITISK